MDSITVDLSSFSKFNGKLDFFIVLQLIHEERYDTLRKLLGLLEEPVGSKLINSILNILEDQEYIKITGDEVTDIHILKKGSDIFGAKVSFDSFWDKYREITGLPKHEKAIANKFFNRLNSTEKMSAYNDIEDYYQHRCAKFNGKPCPKKAVYYLEYKLWNNESDMGNTDNISML